MNAEAPTPQLSIEFAGPFSWPGAPGAPSLFEAPVGTQPGIYLWTIGLADGHLVYYVGETGRSFGARMREHFQEHAAAMYTLNDPASFALGRRTRLWPGRYSKSDRKSFAECVAKSADLAPQIASLTGLYRFFLGPLSCEVRLRKRIEAAIALSLYSAGGVVGEFQEEGIRYEPRLPTEAAVNCALSSTATLLGMPPHVLA